MRITMKYERNAEVYRLIAENPNEMDILDKLYFMINDIRQYGKPREAKVSVVGRFGRLEGGSHLDLKVESLEPTK